MSNNLLNNTASLQNILEALQNKATPSGGIDTTDATATAEDIAINKTAYVQGSKITGTFSLEEELTEQDNLIAQLQNAVDNLPEASMSNVSYDVCTVELSCTADTAMILNVAYTTVDDNNNIVAALDTVTARTASLTCLCNSCMVVHVSDCTDTILDKAQELGIIGSINTIAFYVTAGKNEVATIHVNYISDNGGAV